MKRKVVGLSLIIMMIVWLVLLTGCKDTKNTDDEWLKNMEKVSYIKLGHDSEEKLDNTLAKIIIETYDKSTDEEVFLANQNGSVLGHMFYFYDDSDNLLFQMQCNYDGYYGDKICVMVVEKKGEKDYKYTYHTFKSTKGVEYVNNIVKQSNEEVLKKYQD